MLKWALAAFVTGLGSLVWAPVIVGSPSASVRGCAASDLVVWLDTQGRGAAGSVYYSLRFTNLSGHACALAGYPGVSAIGIGGRQLGRAARRNPVRVPRRFTLANGATAHTVLRITEAANFPASACRAVTAGGLRVYPPNQRASKVIPYPFRACTGTGPTYLSVEAVAQGFGARP